MALAGAMFSAEVFTPISVGAFPPASDFPNVPRCRKGRPRSRGTLLIGDCHPLRLYSRPFCCEERGGISNNGPAMSSTRLTQAAPSEENNSFGLLNWLRVYYMYPCTARSTGLTRIKTHPPQGRSWVLKNRLQGMRCYRGCKVSMEQPALRSGQDPSLEPLSLSCFKRY